MEIGDFNTSSVTLEDFTKEPSEVDGAQLSRKSTAQAAASVSLTFGDLDVESFRRRRDEFQSYPGRLKFSEENEAERGREVQRLMADMQDILLSEDFSEEEKLTALNIANGEAEFVPQSTSTKLMVQGLSNDLVQETSESDASRSLFTESLQEVVDIKRQQAALVNAYRQERLEDGQNLIVQDLGELIVPFAEWIQVDQLNRGLGIEDGVLLGGQKEALFKFIEQAPISEKIRLTERLIEYIDQNDQVILSDGNDMMALEILERMAIDNDYSNFEKWFDNAVSILDIVGLGGLVGAGGKALRGGTIAKRVSRTTVNPSSPSQIVKEANPDTARGMHRMVVEDETGEAAEALYGTTREEALAKDILPEPEVEAGKMENKTDLGPQFEEPEAVKVIRTRDGETYLTPEEIARDRQRIVTRADDIDGFKLQKESTVIKTNEDGSTTFRFRYSPVNSGWSTAAKAVENAKFAMRDFGLTDEAITLYKRNGAGEWVETTPTKIAAEKRVRDKFVAAKKKIPAELKTIDYSVGIDYKHRFNASEFDDMFDRMPVSRLNFLDRITGLGILKGSRGSLTQHLVDPRSLLDSDRVVGPAAAAIDRSVRLKKLFVDEFEDFSAGYAKLKKQDRARMRDYINEANLEGIRFNKADLLARGFGQKDIELLKNWRRANDALYHAANADMAHSLRMRGRKVLTDGLENTLVALPLKRSQVGPRTKFYDPTDGSVKTYDGNLDDLYEGGGELVKLETPIDVDGSWVDVSISYGTSKGYLRAIKDDEIVLSYRDGYYPVMYDANFIIKKKLRDVNGNEFTKAVGTATSRKDAERASLKLNADEGDELFFVDEDRRSKTDRARAPMSGEAFEAATSAGLTMQRARGQRLFDAGNDLHKVGHTNLLDPLEAVANQIHALSERVSMRNYLETTKARILDTYKGLVDFPMDKSGRILYPTDVSEIKKSSSGSFKDLADARSMYNYVYSLENGFINQLVDNGFKSLMNFGADILSESKSLDKLLRDTGKASPSSGIKGLAFKLYLAANPARQIVIQSAQVNQLTAVFPDYILKGGLTKDLFKLNNAAMGLSKDKEALEMLKQIEAAGFTVAVDANNLVRTESLRLADLKVSDKVKSALNAPIDLAQKIGFDKGEQFVLITSWLAHRAKAIKDGKKLNARTYDEISGEARAYTWDMNKAGDMPYTGNELNVIFQFLQVPHKASFQPLFNRQLSRRQKLQLLGWNTAMYGIPTVVLPPAVAVAINELYGEDSEMTTVINDGLIDYMLNGLLTAASGEEQQIDFGAFKPTDIMGTATMATSVLTTDLATLFSESPSASLIFGNNPRLTNFAKTTARWVVPPLDYDSPENQTNYKDVVTEGLKLFSGMSNGFKAYHAFKTRQKLSSLGNITDSDVTAVESAAQFFGFPTKTEEGIRKARELQFGDQQFVEDDVRIWYNELKRHLARKGVTAQEREFTQRVMSEVWASFEPWETKAQESLMRMIERDAAKGELDFLYDLVRNSGGIKDTTEVRQIIQQMPKSEVRTNLLKDLDLIDEAIERYNDG